MAREDAFTTTALCRVLTDIKDGTHGTHSRVSDGVPFLSAKNISDSGRVLWDSGDDQISEADYRSLHRSFQLREHDVLLTIVGSLGRRAIHDGSKVTFQRSVAYMRVDHGQLLPRFLFHAIGVAGFQRALVQRSNATAQAGLYLGELAQIEIPLPRVAVQRHIAEILDTLDEAIRSTEQLIAKLKQVKQGLLHDLLTCGIDDNGELRGPTRHPEQFKGSSLGRIPTSWRVGGLLDVGSTDRQPILTGPFGAQLGSTDFRESGVPLLRIGNVQWGYLDLTDLLHVSEEKAISLARYRVQPGDLLFARQGATTGRNALAEARTQGFLINYHIIRVAVDQSRCHPTFLYSVFNSSVIQRQVDREKGRSTREGVSTGTLTALHLPIPPIDEQIHFARIVEAHDAHAHHEELALSKLRVAKRGLMEDLLTGRVRVTDAAQGEAT